MKGEIGNIIETIKVSWKKTALPPGIKGKIIDIKCVVDMRPNPSDRYLIMFFSESFTSMQLDEDEFTVFCDGQIHTLKCDDCLIKLHCYTN